MVSQLRIHWGTEAVEQGQVVVVAQVVAGEEQLR